MLRRCLRLLGSTNRYTDGSGRKLESNELPRDLYLQTISNRAYPVKGEHWQPVVADMPSPHKGNVIVSGAGVVGLTIASLFALRGWHTTVLDKSPSLPPQLNFRAMHERRVDNSDDEGGGPCATPYGGARSGERGAQMALDHPARRPDTDPSFPTEPHQSKDPGSVTSSGTDSSHQQTCIPFQHPFIDLEYTLLSRRAADALEMAGVRVGAIRHLGVPVSGVLDHPGDFNSWLTRGLTEYHPFAVRMLSIDLFGLRRHLEAHICRLPNDNARFFYEHVIEAVYPLRQQVVVRPWAKSALSEAKETAQASKGAGASSSQGFGGKGVAAAADGPQARVANAVARARVQPWRRRHTSLMLSSMKWDAKYADEAVDYDLIVCSEGVNSHLRDLLDVEGFAADIDMGTKWFLLQSDVLSHAHIHRWLRRRRTTPVPAAELYHVRSAYQVPMCAAFPRVDGGNLFSLMVYMPIGELETLTDGDVLRYLLADVARRDPGARLQSFVPYIHPTPTIFCENLFNSVGLPSAVMVGNAGHNCHPFWMQGLAIALEDGVNLLNQVDAYSRHFYDAVKQYSDERGANGDALRMLTERCLYYQRQKHRNPFIRFQNAYQRCVNHFLPQNLNDMYNGSTNHLYSKSLEVMLNGRGYTSYEFAEKQQVKHNSSHYLGRLYT